MKFYRVSYIDYDEGCVVEWTTNIQAASYRRREIRKMFKELPDDPPTVEIKPMTIPTTKKALCGWLNKHMTRDNG